ncbi:hypothetical protein ACHQM5_006049 [Ranunculus cassubicifolius]
MNIFKSVFSDDPESSSSDPDEPQQPLLTPEINLKNPNFTPKSPSSSSTNTWSFGGLIKTIASKSEVVIQKYQKDLEEFSSELKKETAVIRQAVKDLPASLEFGASVAQEKLEFVGQVIDDLGNTESEIIIHGKDFVLNDNEQKGEKERESRSGETLAAIERELEEKARNELGLEKIIIYSRVGSDRISDRISDLKSEPESDQSDRIFASDHSRIRRIQHFRIGFGSDSGVRSDISDNPTHP